MEKIEILVLKNLIFNEDYVRQVLPYIKSEYFISFTQKVLFDEIQEFTQKYNDPVTKEALLIEVERRSDLNESSYKEIVELINSLDSEPSEYEWLVNTTERWCKERAIGIALEESIMIATGQNKKKNQDAIPGILTDALSVSFDNHIGHDYLQDYMSRYESYKSKQAKIPFDLKYFNLITKGGIEPKTINIILAGTNVGKSLAMCHFATSFLAQNRNVLYITLEMAENKIAERIDANLLNVNIDDIESLSKSAFERKVLDAAKKTTGSLIIKEYPTSSAHAGHFKSLLNELYLKKSFKPDVVFIDYLNICSSSRYTGNLSNPYVYVKLITEELRGLAVEYNVPIFTATQTNRCLALDTIVTKDNGDEIEIQNIKVGDKILSHSGYVNVEHVYPIEVQDVYEITTESGKKIICSDKHIFPTVDGQKSILEGLSVGDYLFVKCQTLSETNLDKITSIKKIDKRETIDITVSGDNLFFANDILTHNSGFASSDLELTDTSESFGITFNADMMFALISTEELEKTNQLLVKQLKNRYSDKSVYRKFLIGIDRPKMRLYDCEQSAQEGLLDKPDDLSYDNEEENNFKSKIRGFVFNE